MEAPKLPSIEEELAIITTRQKEKEEEKEEIVQPKPQKPVPKNASIFFSDPKQKKKKQQHPRIESIQEQERRGVPEASLPVYREVRDDESSNSMSTFPVVAERPEISQMDMIRNMMMSDEMTKKREEVVRRVEALKAERQKKQDLMKTIFPLAFGAVVVLGAVWLFYSFGRGGSSTSAQSTSSDQPADSSLSS